VRARWGRALVGAAPDGAQSSGHGGHELAWPVSVCSIPPPLFG